MSDTCTTTTNCKNTPVTCGVESSGAACEFEGFNGATTQVTCGQQVVIGTACCGGCGCIPVEVYFDGTYCWQGLPKCMLPEFADQVFHPHATTTPNPSFMPPSSFYLGSGGIGGSAGASSTSGGHGGGTPVIETRARSRLCDG